MVRKGCTACYDLVAEFPAPSVEGIDAVARAYHDIGMRAVIAPMMADRSFYRGDPRPARRDAARPARARARRSGCSRTTSASRPAARCSTAGAWTATQLRPALGPDHPAPLQRRVHHRLPRSRARARHRRPDARRGIEGAGRGRPEALRHDARRPSRTSSACWRRTSRRRMRSGSTTTTSRGSPMPAPRSRTIPAATSSSARASPRRARCRDRGITFGIGTDGCLSSDNLNMFEAMRLAAFGSRVQGPDPREWLSRRRGASRPPRSAAPGRSASRSRSAGSRPGYKADVVFLDLTSINYVPLNDPLLNVVFCEDGTGIDRVMIGGRMRRGGRQGARRRHAQARRHRGSGRGAAHRR